MIGRRQEDINATCGYIKPFSGGRVNKSQTSSGSSSRMEFTVALNTPFSLEHTLGSGQLFRWERRGEWWFGVVSGAGFKVRQEGDTLRCSSGSDLVDNTFVTNYFRLDEDLDHILASIAKDEEITKAIEKFYGLRLVRQDPWECLGSFVLATNANIPRIKKMVSSVCSRYGEPTQFEGDTYHAFPNPEILSKASVPDLRGLGLGYRAPFLKHVAKSVAEGKVDFSRMPSLSYDKSQELLLTELFGEKLLLGVGPKVADCVLLYSLGKDEAFPIDVWIARVLAKSYPHLLPKSLRSRLLADLKFKLSIQEYRRASSSIRSHFGMFAGYAQQYLYMAAREDSV
ncbi:MAG: 8-oxoguanine DNA glycosylase [Thaumarchaeota archaeon]|nr:8-oxoguanine DNA glycosylase [Nitrososphaerota archaeon]